MNNPNIKMGKNTFALKIIGWFYLFFGVLSLVPFGSLLAEILSVFLLSSPQKLLIWAEEYCTLNSVSCVETPLFIVAGLSILGGILGILGAKWLAKGELKGKLIWGILIMASIASSVSNWFAPRIFPLYTNFISSIWTIIYTLFFINALRESKNA